MGGGKDNNLEGEMSKEDFYLAFSHSMRGTRENTHSCRTLKKAESQERSSSHWENEGEGRRKTYKILSARNTSMNFYTLINLILKTRSLRKILF